MSCSADYFLVTSSQRRLVGADVYCIQHGLVSNNVHTREKRLLYRVVYCSVCPFGILLCILCDTHGPHMLMWLAYPAIRLI